MCMALPITFFKPHSFLNKNCYNLSEFHNAWGLPAVIEPTLAVACIGCQPVPSGGTSTLKAPRNINTSKGTDMSSSGQSTFINICKKKEKTPLIFYVFMTFSPVHMYSAPAMSFKYNLIILISGQWRRSSDRCGSSQEHLSSKDFQE